MWRKEWVRKICNAKLHVGDVKNQMLCVTICKCFWHSSEEQIIVCLFFVSVCFVVYFCFVFSKLLYEVLVVPNKTIMQNKFCRNNAQAYQCCTKLRLIAIVEKTMTVACQGTAHKIHAGKRFKFDKILPKRANFRTKQTLLHCIIQDISHYLKYIYEENMIWRYVLPNSQV